MATDLQDFHYMSVLRQLEIEAGYLKGGRRESTDRKKVGRLMKIFDALQELARKNFDQGEAISKGLKLSKKEQLEVEKAIVANLRRLTEGREPTDETRLVAGEWPPVIPVSRMVERFTGVAIGLHAENPRATFAANLAAAFEEAVIPALAWGLMIRLYELPEELRRATQAKLALRLVNENTPAETEVRLEGEGYRKVTFTGLRLVEAWFRLFANGKLCALPAEDSRRLRRQLAGLFDQPLSELDSLLWQKLGSLYVSTLAGSERARAVAMASGHAAFLRERLALFDAAMRDGMQDFRLRTEQRLDDAVKQPFACDQDSPADSEKAGLEACGAAFWLARACFGKHGRLHEDEASSRIVLLLVRAAELLSDQPDRASACLRYAAGFATNPRYTRSSLVIVAQEKLVERYAAGFRPRQALVEQFRGRIAWQRWHAGDKKAKGQALAHYAKALRLHNKGGDGLDSEGPIHFFPELVVLLGQAEDRKEREQSTLEAVDFITQRNYGIYFDIVREQELLQTGLEEYKEVRAQIAAAVVRGVKRDTQEKKAAAVTAEAKAAAEKAAEEQEKLLIVDENLMSNWESLTLHSDPAKYRALLRELMGE
jgi:hypothetical protein